ncbi:hypothetical protein AXG93_146s1170 [Marchantia polymorpha subsp. ruderalis]|uniref:Uncharacterized protein n=1 Tax=Marchantia polymorpha subsp. ruderalis TaxID=1480154 RepID=A0A176W9G3_MARPO|nr:hypothetical protein AXG93_146s1170 [Marchantia polymorpha subsp. ruderalis]
MEKGHDGSAMLAYTKCGVENDHDRQYGREELRGPLLELIARRIFLPMILPYHVWRPSDAGAGPGQRRPVQSARKGRKRTSCPASERARLKTGACVGRQSLVPAEHERGGGGRRRRRRSATERRRRRTDGRKGRSWNVLDQPNGCQSDAPHTWSGVKPCRVSTGACRGHKIRPVLAASGPRLQTQRKRDGARRGRGGGGAAAAGEAEGNRRRGRRSMLRIMIMGGGAKGKGGWG